MQERAEKSVKTPFGEPSDVLVTGYIEGVPCVLLARHGRDHTIMPTNINYRANIWALKEEGCTHILVTTACGSLKETIHPGDCVILDQFIDRTTKRTTTFYDGGPNCLKGVCHIPMDKPFCSHTRDVIIKTAKDLGDFKTVHTQGTAVTIEGPRFSSKAESFLWRQWGADIVNMTTVPEVCLAKEVGLCYAAVALPTDYDSWRSDGDSVNVENVMRTFRENSEKAKNLLVAAVPRIASQDWSDTIRELKVLAQASVVS